MKGLTFKVDENIDIEKSQKYFASLIAKHIDEAIAKDLLNDIINLKRENKKLKEENKNKIEKLSYEATRLFAGGKVVKNEVDVDIVTIIDKINEIIDKINNMEE